jgi:Putative zinc ribbon domain
MFKPKGPLCQSCGMPLSRDPQGGGTNADGSRNGEYCSHCFREGRFTEPEITAAEMAAKVEGKLRGMHFPGFLARRFARDTHRLRRWSSSPG